MYNKQILALGTPVMTKEQFANNSGLRAGQIRGQMNRGNVPMFKVGRLSLVNVIALYGEETTLDICPTLTKERFSQLSGLTIKQVESQIDAGNLESKRIGRLVLVDLASLTKRCMKQAEDTQEA